MSDTSHHQRRAVPDGGWGWAVVCGVAIYMFIVLGINRCFSLIVENWRETFAASAQATSLSYTIHCVVCTMSGPLCSVLVVRFGVRITTIAGSLVTTVALVATSFAPSLLLIYISFGVMFGFGSGLVGVTKEVNLTQWFDRHRAKACSIPALASAMGAVAIGPLIQICLEEYGPSGAMLILAGLGFHSLIYAACARPPYKSEIPLTKRGRCPETENRTYNREIVDGKKGNDVSRHQDIDGCQRLTASAHETDGNTDDIVAECIPEKYTSNDLEDIELHNSSCQVDRDTVPSRKSASTTYWDLFRNTQLMAYCFIIGTSTTANGILFTFFAGLAREHNISLRNSSYLMALNGVLITVSLLGVGVFLDLRVVRAYRKEIMGVLYAVMGISMVLFSLLRNVYAFLTTWLIYSCADIVISTQFPVVLIDVIHYDDYTCALGILRFGRGLGYIIGPPVGGFLKDHTGEYSYSFLYGGLLALFSATVYLAVMLLERRRGRLANIPTD